MALHWSIEDCEDADALFEGIDEDRDLTPKAKALVFATMAVGIGDITEKNWSEFYGRVNLFERLSGPYCRQFNEETKRWDEDKIRPEDVHRMIGLTTNVYPKESRSKWLTRMVGGMLTEGEARAERWLRDQKREAEAAV